jgi:DNA-binding MarR family transcriptional regulator
MPLLEPSDLSQGPVGKEYDQNIVILNAVLLRTARALLFRLDEHSQLDELPISQIRCLNAIGNDEGRKMQEIAARLDIKLPAMSQIVERLVQRGLVDRRTDPSDRRVTRLHLTEEAKGLINTARAARLDHLQEAASELGPEKIARMIDDLGALAEAGERAHRRKIGGVNASATANGEGESQDPLVEMMARRARGVRRAGADNAEESAT